MDLRVAIGSAVLRNPTIAASGCYNRGAEYGAIADVSRYGAVTLKSVTRQPRLGNDMPRIASTPSGMLNAIGLQGPGIEYFLTHDARMLGDVPTAVIASVAGFTVDEFADVASAMDGLPNVVAIELDVSCPNVDREGVCFAAEPASLAKVVAAVKAARSLSIPFVLTARAEGFLRGVTDLDDVIKRLQAFEAAGADVLFAPGLPDLAAVKKVCGSLKKPFNFMVGIKGKSFSKAELEAAGVKRISLATSLYRAAMTGLLDAAKEVKDKGTFGYLDRSISTPDLNAFMKE